MKSGTRRYPLFLALFCAILAVVLFVELTTENGDLTEAPPAKPQPTQPGQEGETQSDFVMPPEDTYDEISERPVFLRSRRPLSPEQAIEVKEEKPVDRSRAAFILSGVILTDTQRMALLQSQRSPKVAHIEEGQEYEGWTVEAIHPNKVVVRRGQEVSEIVLEDRARKPPLRDRRSIRKRTKAKQPPENENTSKEPENEDKSKEGKDE